MHSLKTLCRILLSIALSALLISCERNTPEAMLENYQYRISNVMDVAQTPLPALPVRPLFPLRRNLMLSTIDLREGLLDVMNLKECNLLPLIAERNSSLGKVYTPSKKMRYELRFYHALTLCKKHLGNISSSNNDLLTQVNHIYRVKTQNLPAELWNGIFTSKEIALNFSRDKQPLPLIDDHSTSNSIHAIKTLNRIISAPLSNENWQLPAELADIEVNYEILYSNRSGAKVLSSLQLITSHLQQAADTLEQGLKQKPLCFNNTPSAKAKIMQNIFYKYYIGEVQPYLAMTHKYFLAWSTANNALISSFKEYGIAPPKPFTDFQHVTLSTSEHGSLWSEYINARKKHTQRWQKLLTKCGMMPTQHH